MSTGESKKESPKVKNYFPEEYTHGWCPASTRRLLMKLAQHKPAGLAKHFHLMCLVDLLNHIYEDETDIIFEEYLDEENLNELKRRRAQSSRTELMKFPPLYKIRPTAKQIQDKLEELYGMEIVESNELIPDEISIDVDYELPDYVLEMPDPDLDSIPMTPSPQPSLPVTPVAEKPATTRKSQKADSKPSSSTVSATSRRGNVRVSGTQNQTVSQPTKASVKGLSTAERKAAVNSDAELFSPPAPQRATRAAAAAAAASVSNTSASKRRSGANVATASPSPSPHSSRSSTPASSKRER